MTTVAGPPLEYEDDDEAPRDLTIAELDAIEAAHKASTNGHKAAPSQRVPPHNLAAEESLLGAWLLSVAARDTLAVVGPGDFYKPAHGHIAHAIATLHHRGDPIDTVTVADELDRHGLLGGVTIDGARGPAALDALHAPSTSNAPRYAAIVADMALLRRIAGLADEISTRAYELPDDPAALAADTATALNDLVGIGSTGDLAAHLVTGPAVLDIPPPQPLVGDTLNLDSFAVLYGRPGAGKSALALDIGLCVASGAWWHGREVTAGPVLYVAGEGQAGLGARANAWTTLNRVSIPDTITWLTRAASLLDPASTSQLTRIVEQRHASLVVIDTLNRAMPGGNENGPEDMGTVIASCDRLRRATGACVMLVHHSGKDTSLGARGHSSLFGAIDTELEVKNGDGVITVTTTKQKEGSDRDLPLRLALVPTADSVAIGTASQLPDVDGEITPVARLCLDALDRVAGPAGVSTAIWRDASIEAGASRTQFYEQVKRLAEQGHTKDVSSGGRPAWVPDAKPDDLGDF